MGDTKKILSNQRQQELDTQINRLIANLLANNNPLEELADILKRLLEHEKREPELAAIQTFRHLFPDFDRNKPMESHHRNYTQVYAYLCQQLQHHVNKLTEIDHETINSLLKNNVIFSELTTGLLPIELIYMIATRIMNGDKTETISLGSTLYALTKLLALGSDYIAQQSDINDIKMRLNTAKGQNISFDGDTIIKELERNMAVLEHRRQIQENLQPEHQTTIKATHHNLIALYRWLLDESTTPAPSNNKYTHSNICVLFRYLKSPQIITMMQQDCNFLQNLRMIIQALGIDITLKLVATFCEHNDDRHLAITPLANAIEHIVISKSPGDIEQQQLEYQKIDFFLKQLTPKIQILLFQPNTVLLPIWDELIIKADGSIAVDNRFLFGIQLLPFLYTAEWLQNLLAEKVLPIDMLEIMYDSHIVATDWQTTLADKSVARALCNKQLTLTELCSYLTIFGSQYVVNIINKISPNKLSSIATMLQPYTESFCAPSLQLRCKEFYYALGNEAIAMLAAGENAKAKTLQLLQCFDFANEDDGRDEYVHAKFAIEFIRTLHSNELIGSLWNSDRITVTDLEASAHFVVGSSDPDKITATEFAPANNNDFFAIFSTVNFTRLLASGEISYQRLLTIMTTLGFATTNRLLSCYEQHDNSDLFGFTRELVTQCPTDKLTKLRNFCSWWQPYEFRFLTQIGTKNILALLDDVNFYYNGLSNADGAINEQPDRKETVDSYLEKFHNIITNNNLREFISADILSLHELLQEPSDRVRQLGRIATTGIKYADPKQFDATVFSDLSRTGTLLPLMNQNIVTWQDIFVASATMDLMQQVVPILSRTHTHFGPKLKEVLSQNRIYRQHNRQIEFLQCLGNMQKDRQLQEKQLIKLAQTITNKKFAAIASINCDYCLSSTDDQPQKRFVIKLWDDLGAWIANPKDDIEGLCSKFTQIAEQGIVNKLKRVFESTDKTNAATTHNAIMAALHKENFTAERFDQLLTHLQTNLAFKTPNRRFTELDDRELMTIFDQVMGAMDSAIKQGRLLEQKPIISARLEQLLASCQNTPREQQNHSPKLFVTLTKPVNPKEAQDKKNAAPPLEDAAADDGVEDLVF